MAQVQANGITIEYDEHGDPAAPPVLLVMGLGAQMLLWPQELVDALVEHGFRVIRYDNRDIGLSHKFERAKAPGIVRLLLLSKLGSARARWSRWFKGFAPANLPGCLSSRQRDPSC